MPIKSSMVGACTDPITQQVDARWLMAYAAGVLDDNPRLLDSYRHQIVAHPLFPVCLEWPVFLAAANLPGYEALSADEAARGVHGIHDLFLSRPIRPDENLTTQATVVAVKRIKAGAAQVTRLDTRDTDERIVVRTYQTNVFRGVEIVGDDCSLESLPVAPQTRDGKVLAKIPMPISAFAAHHYTECARIWNPIHTDVGYARSAGLPTIVLHGTATLAMAVSKIVNTYLKGEVGVVRRIGAKFSGLVTLPADLCLQVTDMDNQVIGFFVSDSAGAVVLKSGYVVFAD